MNFNKSVLYLSAVFLITTFTMAQSSKVITKGNRIYAANTVIIKLKSNLRQSPESDILQKPMVSNLITKEGISSSNYMFNKPAGDNLANIIVVEYSSTKDPEELSSEILKSGDVEWCEPRYLYPVDFTPTDTALYRQYQLSKIQAQQAWDVSKGDTSIIIAIIDTGVDWDHPDLAANIWRNWRETPNNGIDDDQNGFFDDIRGWDFGGVSGISDNDPMEDKPDHGTHVAGIASAVTNNTIGIASIGYNSKLMAVKTSRNDVRGSNGAALIYYGYEGIVYAADNGAKVINLSWGIMGFSSRLEQEVVDYTISKGALIVAAAGNDNSREFHYPSSYKGVLSVGATDVNDIKASYSNFGGTLDVTAPGTSVYSTWQNNTYAIASGTSMAAPLVSGLAALVWQQFPSYTPLQIGEQIRVNSDDIYSSNNFYRNLLGKGRINAFNAVNNRNSVSVRGLEFNFSDPSGNNNQVFEPGELIELEVQFINYLNPVDNLLITLQSLDNYSTIVNGTFNAGSRGMLESFSNSSAKFTIQLANSLPQDIAVTLKLNYSSGAYTDFELINVQVNPSYIDQANGKIVMTIGSDGTLGFVDTPENLRGSGFRYNGGENLLFEGALMLGTSASKISDAARNLESRSDDFHIVEPFRIQEPGTLADQQGSGIFTDDNAGTSRIGVTVHLQSFSYLNDAEDDFIILKYTITNTNSTNISGLYAGLFFDWDFADAVNDLTAYDTQGGFGYVQRVGGNPNVWIASASGDISKGGFYAIRNDGTQGNINLFDADQFSDADKWRAISSGIGVQSTGPGDISHVISNGPYDIAPGASVEVPFIIAGALNLEQLRMEINTARVKLSSLVGTDDAVSIPVEFSLSQNYPNPFNPSTKIEFSLPQQANVSLKIFNVLGEQVAVLLNSAFEPGRYYIAFNPAEYNLAGGVYMYEITAGDFKSVKKMLYLK